MAAIDISRFVSIRTKFPKSSGIPGRTFGGLVFTSSAMLADVGDYKKEDFNTNGKVITLRYSEVGEAFGKTTDETVVPEYEFANEYFGYVSPSGTNAKTLSFAKILTGETPVQAFNRVVDETNMFGSFTILGEYDATKLLAVAQANASSENEESKFLFVVNREKRDGDVFGHVSAEDEDPGIVDEADTFKNVDGTVFIYGKTLWSSCMPMAILAATDFDDGEVSVHMFKQFSGEEPVGIKDSQWNDCKTHRINFCGRTQTNGSTIDFYQLGFNTNGTDTGVFCNEMWFRSACVATLIDLQLGVERVPADAYGVSLVRGRVIDIANDAVSNGAFMAKVVKREKREEIVNEILRVGGTAELADDIITGVESSGFYVWAYLDTDESDEYIIRWYVFYGSADSVRSFKGVDFVIK